MGVVQDLNLVWVLRAVPSSALAGLGFSLLPSQGEAGKPLESARSGCGLSLPVPSITQHNVTPQPGKFREKQFSVSPNLPIRPLRAGLEMTAFSTKTSFGKWNGAFFLPKTQFKTFPWLLVPPFTPWVKSTTRFWLFESQGRALKCCPSPREVSQHSSEPEHLS